MSRCGTSSESLEYMKEQAYCRRDDAQQIDLLPFEEPMERESIIEGRKQSDIEMDDAVQQHVRPCPDQGSSGNTPETAFSIVRGHRLESRHLTYQRHHTDHKPSDYCSSEKSVGHAMDRPLMPHHVVQGFEIDHDLRR